MKVKSESEVTQLCPTLSDPMAAAYQAPQSMGFYRPEYWSGVPLPSLSLPVTPSKVFFGDFLNHTTSREPNTEGFKFWMIK